MREQTAGCRSCHKRNVTYEYTCKVCGKKYVGDTNRNQFTRGGEHYENHDKRKADSWMYNHQTDDHNGAIPEFTVRVLASFRESLSRQVSEGVTIRRTGAGSADGNSLLNSKLEFYQQATYRVSQEVVRG